MAGRVQRPKPICGAGVVLGDKVDVTPLLRNLIVPRSAQSKAEYGAAIYGFRRARGHGDRHYLIAALVMAVVAIGVLV